MYNQHRHVLLNIIDTHIGTDKLTKQITRASGHDISINNDYNH